MQKYLEQTAIPTLAEYLFDYPIYLAVVSSTIILLVLMAVMTVFLVRLLNNDQQIPLGKNYSTITRPVTETTEQTEETLPPEPVVTAPSAAPIRHTAAVQPSETGK